VLGTWKLYKMNPERKKRRALRIALRKSCPLSKIFNFNQELENKIKESWTLEISERVWRKIFPLGEEDLVREHPAKINAHKSMNADGIHPHLLRELAEVIAELLSIIFERSWRKGKVPEDRRVDNVTLVFRKGKKKDLGNYRLVSLTSVPGKVMEQLVLHPLQAIGRE